MDTEFQFCKMKLFWRLFAQQSEHNNNEHLKWLILCYVYCTTIKNKVKNKRTKNIMKHRQQKGKTLD